MNVRQSPATIEITKVIPAGGPRWPWPKVIRHVQASLERRDPFIVTGEKERARKLIARIREQHPDTPVRVMNRGRRSDPWIAVIGADPLSMLEVYSSGGPAESIRVTATPTLADQGAAYRAMMEEWLSAG